MTPLSNPDLSDAKTAGGVRRREFLIDGAKVVFSLAALNALSFPARADDDGSGRDESVDRTPLDGVTLHRPPAGLDDTLSLLAAYLVHYAPPQGEFPESGAWTARYDVIEWIGSARGRQAFSRKNHVVGRTAITRVATSGGGSGYEVAHELEIHSFKTALKSSIRCAAGPFPGLAEWTTEYSKHPLRPYGTAVTLTEKGRHRDGVLEIESAAGTRRFRTERPVAPQWVLVDALRSAKEDKGDAVVETEFDFLHDLTSYRPRQRLLPCGTIQASLAGETRTVHGFVQRGIGTEPMHYWLDSAGRPLFLTGGLLSSALVSVGPA